jgi:hypothetical protein
MWIYIFDTDQTQINSAIGPELPVTSDQRAQEHPSFQMSCS